MSNINSEINSAIYGIDVMLQNHMDNPDKQKEILDRVLAHLNDAKIEAEKEKQKAEDRRSAKERGEVLKAMNTLVGYMNNEEALYNHWLYIVPDGADNEELEDIAENDEDTFTDAVNCFMRLCSCVGDGRHGFYIGKKTYGANHQSGALASVFRRFANMFPEKPLTAGRGCWYTQDKKAAEYLVNAFDDNEMDIDLVVTEVGEGDGTKLYVVEPKREGN